MADEIGVTRATPPERERAVERSAPLPQSTAEARRRIEEARDRISSDLDAIGQRVSNKKHWFRRRKDRLERKADEAAGPAREQIRARPWAGLGAAVGAGFLVAWLAGRDERSDSGALSEREREQIAGLRAELRALRRDIHGGR